MDELISAILDKPTRTVGMDDSVETVEAVLRMHQVSAVPVVNGETGAVVGIISARDLVRFHAAKKDAATLRAWEICSYKPLEVGPDARLSDVARLMVTHGIHHVVVTDQQQVKGIVSSLDFVKRYIRDSEAGAA
ncbi:MAG: CBS domain-containing protein [Burkholderiales bacterium]|nr:CBS domain-containing protein [Burkholderiales bacterium]